MKEENVISPKFYDIRGVIVIQRKPLNKLVVTNTVTSTNPITPRVHLWRQNTNEQCLNLHRMPLSLSLAFCNCK